MSAVDDKIRDTLKSIENGLDNMSDEEKRDLYDYLQGPDPKLFNVMKKYLVSGFVLYNVMGGEASINNVSEDT